MMAEKQEIRDAKRITLHRGKPILVEMQTKCSLGEGAELMQPSRCDLKNTAPDR